MRISPTPRVCSGLLCGLLILVAGCGNPSSQNLASLTVTATPSSVPVGGAAVLKAVAHLSDGTTQDVTAGTIWTLSNTALASVVNGAFTAKTAGTLTVQAAYVEVTPAGSSPASTTTAPQNLSASTQVTITPANGPDAINVPLITWNAPAAISYGTTLSNTQLSATANVPGTFAYTPAAGTVLTAGTQTLSATFTPTDAKTYSAATASVQLTVSQAAATINWPTPAPIAPGTALSATQLNATANVPGSFIYNPASGTVLGAGTQQLTGVFSPSDTTDYASATAHTSLVVGAASSGPTSTPSPTTPPPAPAGCGGPTVNLDSGMSQSTLQSTISNAPNCSLIVFAAGTYNISAGLNLKCGVTYAGPAAVPATVILNGSSLAIGSSIFNLYTNGGGPTNPCTAQTLIEYLNFKGADGIYVQTPFTNLLVQYNQFTSIPGSSGSQTSGLGIYNYPTPINTAAELTNSTITHNQFGDANSCVSPTNVMADTDSPEDYNGFCQGITFYTSINGLTVTYNNFNHVSEGAHVNCPQYAKQEYVCEPPGGAITQDLTVEYNDFNNIHRIAWEEQPQQSSGIVYAYNSEHDWVNPYFGSYGLSMACCYNGTLAQPNMTVASNIVVDNVPTTNGDYISYGFEAMGHLGTYNNNLLQMNLTNTGSTNAPGIAWGCGPLAAVNYNTVQGRWGGYIVTEGITGCGNLDTTPASLVGNVTAAELSAITSVAPTISPSAGPQTFPLTVTLTDPGYTSGPQPLANTGIWYTTDGSTPVPGAGTATRLDSGGTFVLSGAATVKAVGMWGAANQPTSYPSSYGFVPSTAVSASYSAGGAIKRPGGTAKSSNNSTSRPAAVRVGAELPVAAVSAALESVAITPTQPVVGIGSRIQLKAIATFDDGLVKDVTADFSWHSSDERITTVNGNGMLAGVASGKAAISGSYQGLQASVSTSSTVGEVVWSGPTVISAGGTYSGNWQSTDSRTPAVMVTTTDPVTIENSHIRGPGNLIATNVPGTNLTVRDSLGLALNAAVKGQPNGNFVEVSAPARLDVENNYVENARGGVIVHGYAGNRNGEQTIVIRANRARNLTGLLSDGDGGYLPGTGASPTPAHFIQLDSVRSVPGIEVGWNEVINYPGQSLVDDNIDLYRSSGTPNQPLEVHDTYIQGAYPYRAQDVYAGGGIQTKGTPTDSVQEAPAFNNIHDNQVIGTVNYGIKFTAGHDNIASNNRVISSGLLADGTRIAAQDVGLANGDASGGAAASNSMYNNTMRDNLVGWTCWQPACAQRGYRKDQFFPAAPADYSTNSVVNARQITLDMENNEYQVWMNKMAAAGIAVGPSF